MKISWKKYCKKISEMWCTQKIYRVGDMCSSVLALFPEPKVCIGIG